jgi:hypothetical protein
MVRSGPSLAPQLPDAAVVGERVAVDGRAERGLDRLFAFMFAAAGWYVGIRALSDNSFLVHLRTGTRILDHGIPRADPYSFTAPGTRWVAQSWLAEAAYGALQRTVGGFGVRLLVATTGAAFAWLLFATARAVTGERRRAATVTLLAWITAMSVFGERPLAFGLLAFAALVTMVEVPSSTLYRHRRVVLPVVLWLWANAHGSFSLGLAYVVVHVIGEWLDGVHPWRANRDLVVTAAAASAFLVVNPYGVHLLTFPVELLGRGDILARVIEWSSPNFREPNGMVLALWLAVAVVALARGTRTPTRRDVAMVVVFGLAALWAQRNIGVFAITTLPVVARQAASGPRRERTADTRLTRLLAVVMAGGIVLVTLAAARGPHYRLDRYPVEAMIALDEGGHLGRRLLTTDDWGGYVVAEYGPARQRVFLDDRFDMYPRRVIDDYGTIADGNPEWRALLDEYRIETVVWPADRVLVQLLALDGDWRETFRDDDAVIFVRR